MNRRIRELDREWDASRVFALCAGAACAVGAALAAVFGPWWLLLAGLGALAVIAAAVGGEAMTEVLMRPFGFRTRTAITEEQLSMRALRGDFDPLFHGEGRGDALRLHEWVQG